MSDAAYQKRRRWLLLRIKSCRMIIVWHLLRWWQPMNYN